MNYICILICKDCSTQMIYTYILKYHFGCLCNGGFVFRVSSEESTNFFIGIPFLVVKSKDQINNRKVLAPMIDSLCSVYNTHNDKITIN